MLSTENLLAQRLTPGQQTMRQYYQGRLAMELAQGASMELNRRMLRRGARKMQDGTLGQPGDLIEEEPVNISIGDTYQVMPATVAATPAPAAPAGNSTAHVVPPPATGSMETAAAPVATSRWKQAAAIAAVLAGMGGSAGVASWLTSRGAQQPAAGQQVAIPGYGVQVEKQPEAKK